MFKYKKTRTVIIGVAAALALAAVIIAVVLIATPKKSYIDGEYVLNIPTNVEMTSTYAFDGTRVENTYFDGEKTVTVEYEYYISTSSGKSQIVMTDTATGKINVYSFSRVEEGGELTAIIINSVWYYKK